jgi:hypothetical protein
LRKQHTPKGEKNENKKHVEDLPERNEEKTNPCI